MIFLQITQMPWWAALIGVATGIALGLFGALPWRSTAQAAKDRAEAAEGERDGLRSIKNGLIEENTQLKAEVAVLKAKTDLNGLKAEMVKAMEDMRQEFRKHSDQDLLAAKDHIEAMSAVNATLQLLQGQIKK